MAIDKAMTIVKALEQLKYDIRLVDYQINNGIYKKTDLQNHLAQLPDLSHNVMTEALEEETSDVEDTSSEEAN